jgi:signal transduction histidine kinase
VPLRLPTVPLTAEVRHSLFLAFKEALHNVVKHARATQAEISLGLEPGGFFITVSDDGRGIQQEPELPNGKPPSAPRVARGNGLANMRKRMADLGGSCHWESPPGQGTRVTFRLKADAGAKFVIKTDDGLPEPGRVD